MAKLTFILGYPGSGKTYFLKHNQQSLRQKRCFDFNATQVEIRKYNISSFLRFAKSMKFFCFLFGALLFSSHMNYRRSKAIVRTSQMYYNLCGGEYASDLIADENIIHRIFIIFFGTKLNKYNLVLIKIAVLIASECCHKLIIMNEDKKICARRVLARSAPLSRFNKHTSQDLLNELIKDEIYIVIFNELRKRYTGEIYEY